MNEYAECYDVGNGVRIQRGFKPRIRGTSPAALPVQFKEPFEGIPAVTVSPVWTVGGNSVKDIETIIDVQEGGFTCYGENADVNNLNNVNNQFGIMWIAIGLTPHI